MKCNKWRFDYIFQLNTLDLRIFVLNLSQVPENKASLFSFNICTTFRRIYWNFFELRSFSIQNFILLFTPCAYCSNEKDDINWTLKNHMFKTGKKTLNELLHGVPDLQAVFSDFTLMTGGTLSEPNCSALKDFPQLHSPNDGQKFSFN
ncbi:hypothetical protein BpHYR1_005205 [Brachionus plicatilis]|uniref:Uncharacterized protein n=1 Tax=Brachionus plicatilis TaxID=10195 RepID=A0A3M7PAE8_BRAPC|nr:hypothetical protein BpHYR1_005205 [Brachionus plicatilis]